MTISSFIIQMLFAIVVIYYAKKYSSAGSSNPEYSLHSFVQEYENWTENGNKNENANANAKWEMKETNEWRN